MACTVDARTLVIKQFPNSIPIYTSSIYMYRVVLKLHYVLSPQLRNTQWWAPRLMFSGCRGPPNFSFFPHLPPLRPPFLWQVYFCSVCLLPSRLSSTFQCLYHGLGGVFYYLVCCFCVAVVSFPSLSLSFSRDGSHEKTHLSNTGK